MKNVLVIYKKTKSKQFFHSDRGKATFINEKIINGAFFYIFDLTQNCADDAYNDASAKPQFPTCCSKWKFNFFSVLCF